MQLNKHTLKIAGIVVAAVLVILIGLRSSLMSTASARKSSRT